MIAQPFAQLIVAQIVITAAALILAVRVLRVPVTSALWAAALCNAVPLTSPAFKTPLFVQDALVPVLLAPALFALRKKNRLIPVLLAAALLWPLVSIVAMRAIDPIGNEWMRFLFRRFGIVVFFLVAFSGTFRHMRIRDVLDSSLLIWIGIIIAGLLQFFGLMNTDIYSTYAEMFRGLPFWMTAAAQTGFMGFNRGAVGVWGTAFGIYSLCMLLATSSLAFNRRMLYIATVVLTVLSILSSGSRTGLVALLGALLFVMLRLLATPQRKRVLQFGVVTAVLLGIAFAWLQSVSGLVNMANMASRFQQDPSSASAGNSRLDIQSATISYILAHPRAFWVGMGASTDQFEDEVGRRANGLVHPHSEYLLVLWDTGIPGLLLYLLFLLLLYAGLNRRYGEPRFELAFAGQAMLIGGMLAGLAVGNFFNTITFLATFSLMMAFVYGKLICEIIPEPSREPARMQEPVTI